MSEMAIYSASPLLRGQSSEGRTPSARAMARRTMGAFFLPATTSETRDLERRTRSAISVCLTPAMIKSALMFFCSPVVNLFAMIRILTRAVKIVKLFLVVDRQFNNERD